MAGLSGAKESSLTVPLWILSSLSLPSCTQLSGSNRNTLMLLSLEPVAMMSPSGFHVTQYIEPLWYLFLLKTVEGWGTPSLKFDRDGEIRMKQKTVKIFRIDNSDALLLGSRFRQFLFTIRILTKSAIKKVALWTVSYNI